MSAVNLVVCRESSDVRSSSLRESDVTVSSPQTVTTSGSVKFKVHVGGTVVPVTAIATNM